MSNTIDAERLSGEFYESGHILRRDQGRPGTVQQKISPPDRFFQFAIADRAILRDRPFYNSKFRKTAMFHLGDFG